MSIVKVIASQSWDVFWDTVSYQNSNESMANVIKNVILRWAHWVMAMCCKSNIIFLYQPILCAVDIFIRYRLNTARDFGHPWARVLCTGLDGDDRVWNCLPQHVTSAPSLSTFRSRLKTHLFSHCYPAVKPEKWFLHSGRSCYCYCYCYWQRRKRERERERESGRVIGSEKTGVDVDCAYSVNKMYSLKRNPNARIATLPSVLSWSRRPWPVWPPAVNSSIGCLLVRHSCVNRSLQSCIRCSLFNRLYSDITLVSRLIVTAHSNGQAIIFLPWGFFCLSTSFMAALCNRAGHIYFHPVVSSSSSSSSSFFFSSPNLSDRRLDVYRTSTLVWP